MTPPPDIIPLLARAMRQPIRCGGCDYVDGKLYLRTGGRLLTPEEFRALEDSLQGPPLNAEETAKLRAWLESVGVL